MTADDALTGLREAQVLLGLQPQRGSKVGDVLGDLIARLEEREHTVDVDVDEDLEELDATIRSFSIEHPLRCRYENDHLRDCPVHRELVRLRERGETGGLRSGRYLVTVLSSGLTAWDEP